MSRLAGICLLDSSPCSPKDETEIRLALADHGKVGLHRTPWLLMGCAASRFGQGPDSGVAWSPDGSVCTWDGCLDNRADLLLQFGHECGPDAPDSAIALTAYRLGGAEGLRGLVGDWSLAIWDASAAAIVLASDYAGVRPLYYCRGGDRLFWSSSLADVVRWSGADELDEDYVASFLTRGSAAHRTPYRGVFPVSPGYTTAISQEGVLRKAFWRPPVDAETRYSDERDYAERLRQLFREAVGVRLSGDGPVCAELSGGLDSSSIVSMIGQLGTADLFTFTYTHEGNPDAKYYTAMERGMALSGIHLDLEAYPVIAADRVGGAAPGWWEARLNEISRRMAELGSATFLTGQFGDFVMGNSTADTEQVAGYIHRGQWWRAAKEAFAWSQSMRVPIYSILWRELGGGSLWPAATDVAFSAGSGASHDDSLAPQFRQRTALVEMGRREAARWRTVAAGRRRRFRGLSEMLEARLLQTPEPLQHIRCRHPFAHRPLVEFMMTIPASVVCRPDEPRRLMRRAFEGFVPAAILKRRSKASYDGPYRKALLPLAAELLAGPGELRAVDLGYLDRGNIRERLHRFTQGLDCNETQLRQILLFEFWLRSKERQEHPAATGKAYPSMAV